MNNVLTRSDGHRYRILFKRFISTSNIVICALHTELVHFYQFSSIIIVVGTMPALSISSWNMSSKVGVLHAACCFPRFFVLFRVWFWTSVWAVFDSAHAPEIIGDHPPELFSGSYKWLVLLISSSSYYYYHYYYDKAFHDGIEFGL